MNLHDSGNRHQYQTGAMRDNRQGKGRFDLISPHMMRRLALRLEAGVIKYSERNWEKGMPLSRFLDALLRHTFQILERDDEEDHAAAVVFNIMAFIHTEEEIQAGRLPDWLNDLPDREEGELHVQSALPDLQLSTN